MAVSVAAGPGGHPATAQEQQLPEIVVTAPSPIVRAPRPRPRPPARVGRAPAPAPAAPAAPEAPPATVPTAPPPGWLPIVADQFATVTVVTRDELERTPGGTLGDVLFAKPGITGSSFAPGASSRPIVRGLDNYRVRIQENGISSSGVSDFAEDHAVPVDPLAAERVEVVRGPATLRWGSQAIGGVVNATNNRIPDALPCPPQAPGAAPFPVKAIGPAAMAGPCVKYEMRGAFNTVDRGVDGAVVLDAGAGNFAFHADTFGRHADDYRIPNYPYLPPRDQTLPFNGRQPNSAMRADGQSVGGSYVFDSGFVGMAVTRNAAFYRLPGLEPTETNTRIDMEQIKVTSRGEFRPQANGIDAVRFWFGHTDYKHNELADEGGFDGIQQTFTNKEQEGRLEVQLLPFDLRFATLTTALGVQGMNQRLTAPGVEGGLFDPNRTTSVAGFMFNEFRLSETLRAQVAGRIEESHVRGSVPDLFVDPLLNIERDRRFTPKSGAIGFLKDLPWDLVGSVTAQYVERAPRAPELLSRGVHEATETFDIGNPNLKIETAKTVEIGIRRPRGQFRFEATAYYTRFSNFIFRNLTGFTCEETIDTCDDPINNGPGGDLSQAIYSQRDATFRGGEFQSQFDVAPLWGGIFGIENQFDVVRATFSDGTNVPRIPPVRVGGGVYWRDANWFARVNLLHAFDQDNIATTGETPTAGYNLLKAELVYTTPLRPNDFGARLLTVGIVGNNLLNEDIRNHVSFRKDEVLMPGRGVRFFATLKN
ncbi:MAG: TonB-dependent receptor [Rhizobiales bacterium]|nr:TonB-dependent receptor [Hyphomicrobiales bacterium]